MQAKPNFIVSLSDASAGLSQVGGKGASLARLAAACPCLLVFTSLRRPIADSWQSMSCKSRFWRLSPLPLPISLQRSKRHPAGSESSSLRVRCRMTSPRRFDEHMPGLARVTCLSPYVLRLPLKTCRRCRLPVSRRPISTCAVKRRCSMPSSVAGLRSGRRGRIAGLVARVPREERMMIKEFGEEYRAYMQRTGRFSPK